MCTRYYVELSPELKPYIEAANASPLRQKMVSHLGKAFRPVGEIRPTDMAAVIAPSAGQKETAFPMIWGYRIPGIDHPVVNARVETAKEKRSFAADFRRHRCIIPAAYYFEWEHILRPDGKMKTGSKYAIQPRGADVTYLAGLYRIEAERGLKYPVFTVLTKAPTEELRKLHDRMPLILPKDAIADWINPSADPDRIIKNAVTDLVLEKAGK